MTTILHAVATYSVFKALCGSSIEFGSTSDVNLTQSSEGYLMSQPFVLQDNLVSTGSQFYVEIGELSYQLTLSLGSAEPGDTVQLKVTQATYGSAS